MDKERVIVKGGELFFPDRKTNGLRVAGWSTIDGHFEADYAFYFHRKPDGEQVSRKLIDRYQRAYNCQLTQVKKMPKGWRK